MRVYHNSTKAHPYWVRLTRTEAEALMNPTTAFGVVRELGNKLTNVKDQADGK